MRFILVLALGVCALGSPARADVFSFLDSGHASQTGPHELAVTPGEDGIYYVFATVNGAQIRFVIDTGSDSVGWFNWLTNLATQSGADNVYNMMVFDQSLAQDAHGNLFLAYPATGGVRLAYSRDGGSTWHQRGIISTKAVTMPWLVSVTARGTGQVAVAYLGTKDVGEKVLGGCERYRNWMGYSPDAFTKPFAMAPTSPATRPAITSGGLLGSLNGNPMGSSIGPGANTHMFVEYTGVRFTATGQVRAAFARFSTDQKPTQNPYLVLGKLAITR